MWIRVSGALGMGNESEMGIAEGKATVTPLVAISVV
jgi:hypothetical protein